MTSKDSSQDHSEHQTDLNDLLRAHLVLVQTHQSLISGALGKSKVGSSAVAALPQTLTEPAAQVSGDSPRRVAIDKSGANLLKDAEPSLESVGAELTDGIAPHDPSTGQSDQRGMGWLLLVFAAMTVAICILIFRPNRGTQISIDAQFKKDRELVTSQLKQSQQQVLAEQERIRMQDEELKRTQRALAETQEALIKTQHALAQANEIKAVANSPAVQKTASASNASESTALSDKERLEQAQQELRNIRMALNANQQELVKNLREYRTTAQTLAINRQGIYKTGLEIRRVKGEISAEELTKQLKPWKDFLPPEARSLIDDPKLNGDSTTTTGRATEAAEIRATASDGVPGALPDVQTLLVKSNAELAAIMKQLTTVQSKIIQTQSEVTAAISELNVKSKELLALESETIVSKSQAPDARHSDKDTLHDVRTPKPSTAPAKSPTGEKSDRSG